MIPAKRGTKWIEQYLNHTLEIDKYKWMDVIVQVLHHIPSYSWNHNEPEY